MVERVCYRLIPNSPFHIGDKGVGLEETETIIHSDTIFSAICIALLQAGENLDALLSEFPQWKDNSLIDNRQPPFLISSAFPFMEKVLFFPKPFLRIEKFNQKIYLNLGKTLKKISFVSAELFLNILANEDVSDELYEFGDNEDSPELREDNLLQSGQVWITENERQALNARGKFSRNVWQKSIDPRVPVDRISNASDIYSSGRVWFTKNSGLFILVEFLDPTYRKTLEKALRILGDSGIGGERSVGNGQFSLEIGEWPFNPEELKEGNAFTTLSLFWPSKDEVTRGVLNNASYHLINRRGWIGAPGGMNLRRRGVIMCREGSVFMQSPRGALLDVKPVNPSPAKNVDHEVWRYGLAMRIPCRSKIQ